MLMMLTLLPQSVVGHDFREALDSSLSRLSALARRADTWLFFTES